MDKEDIEKLFNKKTVEKEKQKLCRELSVELHKKWNKGHKANVLICSLTKDKKIKGEKKTTCHYCKKSIYFDKKSLKNLAKKHKKICGDCAVNKLGFEMNMVDQV